MSFSWRVDETSYECRFVKLIRPTLGFKSMRSARATIAGFELMPFRKGQFRFWIEAVGGGTEVRFINRLFGLTPDLPEPWGTDSPHRSFCNRAPLQLQHAQLRGRATRRGKAANLPPPGRQHPMTRSFTQREQ
jgi:hypothetical protein